MSVEADATGESEREPGAGRISWDRCFVIGKARATRELRAHMETV